MTSLLARQVKALERIANALELANGFKMDQVIRREHLGNKETTKYWRMWDIDKTTELLSDLDQREKHYEGWQKFLRTGVLEDEELEDEECK